MEKSKISGLQKFVQRRTKRLDLLEDSYSKAMRAKLRRAVGKPLEESTDVWEFTLLGAPKKDADIAHTVLTLYALHMQGKDRSMNANGIGFGRAIAKLVDKDNEAAIKRRFNSACTSADFAELAHHARGLIQMMRAKDIGFDYPRFASELRRFKDPERASAVRLTWGEDFYRNIKEEDEE